MSVPTPFDVRNTLNVEEVKYSDEKEKSERAIDINFLFDRNFGKDWRSFLHVFYDLSLQRHRVSFRRIDLLVTHKVVASHSAALFLRKAYYRCAKSILDYYFLEGFDNSLSLIETDNYKVKRKDLEGNWVNLSPSDEVYETMLNITSNIKR